MSINVKDAQFGAIGDGSSDDTQAIQKAINYAKSIATPGGGVYRPTVYFPAGYYLITSPIDITNTTGVWLMGDGGKWLNTCIFGRTSSLMFDFSGSNQSGCQNFYFLSTNQADANRSTIGVQFALTSNGGQNSGIRNCSFLMEDFSNVNSSLGTVGILNVRAEEFFIHECFIRANTPIVMSNDVSLSQTGINYIATSRYQTLTQGTGSMGVTSILGVSIQCYEKRQPALILNGTNSLSFQGYIGRAVANNGTNETAILCSQYTTNLKVQATIESFSRIIALKNASLEGADLSVAIANSTSPTTDLVNLTGCIAKGINVKISLPNVNERTNRYVIYSTPNGGGTQEANTFLKNSTIHCYDIPDNRYIISADLLKKSFNVSFNTETPFEKRSGKIRLLNNSVRPAGNVGSVQTVTVLTFTQANQTAFNNTNGGYYRVWIDGIVRCGSYNSGGACTMSFQAQLLVNQVYNGQFDPVSSTVIILDKSNTNPAYVDIVGLSADISFSNGLGVVTVTPRVTGGGTSEPVNYDGTVELQSDFRVNDPIPIG